MMEIKQVYIVSNNPSNFRFNIPGEVIGVLWVRPDEAQSKYPERLCYAVRWADGMCDYLPVKGEYLFMDPWQKEKFMQDKLEADLRKQDPLKDELEQKAKDTMLAFVDAVEKGMPSPDDPIREGMFVICRTGHIRYVTKLNTDGTSFWDDGKVSGLAPSSLCMLHFYAPATMEEITRWVRERSQVKPIIHGNTGKE